MSLKVAPQEESPLAEMALKRFLPLVDHLDMLLQVSFSTKEFATLRAREGASANTLMRED